MLFSTLVFSLLAHLKKQQQQQALSTSAPLPQVFSLLSNTALVATDPGVLRQLSGFSVFCISSGAALNVFSAKDSQ